MNNKHFRGNFVAIIIGLTLSIIAICFYYQNIKVKIRGYKLLEQDKLQFTYCTNLTDEEKAIVNYDGNSHKNARYLHKKYPNNKVYLANYFLYEIYPNILTQKSYRKLTEKPQSFHEIYTDSKKYSEELAQAKKPIQIMLFIIIYWQTFYFHNQLSLLTTMQSMDILIKKHQKMRR